MVERNVCHELNCPVACCRNINTHYAGGEEWFKLAFPDAIKVKTIDELALKEDIQLKGVYYTHHSGWIYIVINGNCPNLEVNLNCRIHDERFFPNPCRNMIPGSDKCHDLQKKQAVLSAILEESGPIDRSVIFRVIDKLNS